MPPTAPTTNRRARRPQAPALRFDQRLVLNQWILGLFEADSFIPLTDGLHDTVLEGLDENNVSRFHHVIAARLFPRQQLNRDLLLAYDQNIVRHTQTISSRRSQSLRLKYFQYLGLLFMEIYLDRYFRDAEQLLDDLNDHLAKFNLDKSDRDQIKPFVEDDLRKLAFWSATGSGKTLLMHVNICQYRHYLKLHGRERELNRTILLTPNEGLSRQHLQEFAASGIDAEIFSKESTGLFAGHSVEILEITKLTEDSGDKTVAVDAFEGNNLVLVDEGHRGAGGFKWKHNRDRLCEQGFSFEYSATFVEQQHAGLRGEVQTLYGQAAQRGEPFQLIGLPERFETRKIRRVVVVMLAEKLVIPKVVGEVHRGDDARTQRLWRCCGEFRVVFQNALEVTLFVEAEPASKERDFIAAVAGGQILEMPAPVALVDAPTCVGVFAKRTGTTAARVLALPECVKQIG